jgi:hypothetical protein
VTSKTSKADRSYAEVKANCSQDCESFVDCQYLDNQNNLFDFTLMLLIDDSLHEQYATYLSCHSLDFFNFLIRHLSTNVKPHLPTFSYEGLSYAIIFLLFTLFIAPFDRSGRGGEAASRLGAPRH